MTTMATEPMPQTYVPPEGEVHVVTAYGKHGESGVAAAREDARVDAGLLGEALFPRYGTTAVVLALAIAWFGFVRPRLRRRA